jgi:hypothetical protein
MKRDGITNLLESFSKEEIYHDFYTGDGFQNQHLLEDGQKEAIQHRYMLREDEW